MSVVLSAHLPLLATAPNGIQKLRGLILELAVRGKLVPQVPNGEPASELLQQIANERSALESEGLLKKSKPIPPVAKNEQPFSVPGSWVFARLGELTLQVTDGTHHTPNYLPSGVAFISVKDINGLTVSFDDCKYISEEEHQQINQRCNPERGDILLCRIGTLGRPTIVDTDRRFSLFVSVGLLKLPKNVDYSRYLHLVLASPCMAKQYDEIKAGGSHTNKLNLGDIPKLVVPLPPLAEQHRIVAKVDELMALCDRLEAEQADAASAHARLVETLLGTLTQSTDAADLAANWQRLAEHFDTLFAMEGSIDVLKQTVLQLAVMGKLVPQNPADEPASELLKRIATEKDRLSRGGGLRTTAEPHIEADEQYMALPDSWQFQRLGNLAKFIDYRGKTPDKINSGVPLITAKNVRFGFISREPYEFVSEKEYTDWMTRGFPRLGDILFTTEAPLGNAAIVDISEKFALAQRVICFQFHEPHIANYLLLALMSKQVRQQIEGEATGMTATGIKASRLKEIPVPIPPIAEQHRIVAKVDQLMALCDRLKADLAAALRQQATLADTLIESALEAT